MIETAFVSVPAIVVAVKKARARWKVGDGTGAFLRRIGFDNEGPGFTKKANEIRAYKAILDFLDKHLRGSGAPAPAPISG